MWRSLPGPALRKRRPLFQYNQPQRLRELPLLTYWNGQFVAVRISIAQGIVLAVAGERTDSGPMNSGYQCPVRSPWPSYWPVVCTSTPEVAGFQVISGALVQLFTLSAAMCERPETTTVP